MNAPPPGSGTKRFAFVFVCQAGELEIKALLLAASLHRHLRGEFELVAAVPTPADIWGELSAPTRDQLQAFGATIAPIANPLDPDYRIGNKLACIDVPTSAQKIVFLDSDILCLRDFGDPGCLHLPFAAKPADLRTFAAATESWRPLYSAVGLAPPDLHLPTTVSGEFGPPYFNSGVIFVDNGLHFGQAWIDCARAIEATPTMRTQRHWLDQVSLPLAVRKLDLAYSALDERFNFPAHLKPLSEDLPFLCHYHWPRIVRREPHLLALVRELAEAHPSIAQLMSRTPEWASLIEAHAPLRVAPLRPRLAAEPPADILVTGMPAGGVADLLAALANRGCGVRSEPAELVAALAAPGPPWELAAISRAVRADVQSTADAQHDRSVVIGCELAFLCRLDAIRRVLPQARLVACVRDPYATIAAWKSQPPEQFDAGPAWVAANGRHWLPGDALAQFERIAAIGDASEKRAAWWWWLAQRLIEHRHDLTIVRAADLAADGAAVARALVDGGDPRQQSVKAPARASYGALDERDLQAIRAICLQAAADLGVADG